MKRHKHEYKWHSVKRGCGVTRVIIHCQHYSVHLVGRARGMMITAGLVFNHSAVAVSLMKPAYSDTPSISTGVQILLCKYPFTKQTDVCARLILWTATSECFLSRVSNEKSIQSFTDPSLQWLQPPLGLPCHCDWDFWVRHTRTKRGKYIYIHTWDVKKNRLWKVPA